MRRLMSEEKGVVSRAWLWSKVASGGGNGEGWSKKRFNSGLCTGWLRVIVPRLLPTLVSQREPQARSLEKKVEICTFDSGLLLWYCYPSLSRGRRLCGNQRRAEQLLTYLWEIDSKPFNSRALFCKFKLWKFIFWSNLKSITTYSSIIFLRQISSKRAFDVIIRIVFRIIQLVRTILNRELNCINLTWYYYIDE